MASTKADNNRVVWQYTDDNGTNWAVSAKAVYVLDVTDGAKYGGSAPAASVVAKPLNMRMRTVKCVSAGHPDKYVVAYETDAAIWTTPGTQLTLNSNGEDFTYAATAGHRGERYRDGIRQTA
ncbi:MAG TPA: hypothetical protein VIY48_22340 [Candidatus Paceibacterota bacterium]